MTKSHWLAIEASGSELGLKRTSSTPPALLSGQNYHSCSVLPLWSVVAADTLGHASSYCTLGRRFRATGGSATPKHERACATPIVGAIGHLTAPAMGSPIKCMIVSRVQHPAESLITIFSLTGSIRRPAPARYPYQHDACMGVRFS